LTITCTTFTPRDGDALAGRADLILALDGGAALEVRGWSIYRADGERYINPPSVSRAGAMINIMRIVGRRERERFRRAALSAVDAFRANQEVANVPVAAKADVYPMARNAKGSSSSRRSLRR
jgi:hypothetical protein